MSTDGLKASVEALRGLRAYLLEVAMEDKVAERGTSTFTIDAIINMAATLTKCISELKAALGDPSKPQPPNPPPSANGTANAVDEFAVWAEAMRKEALDLVQEQLRKAQEKIKAGVVPK